MRKAAIAFLAVATVMTAAAAPNFGVTPYSADAPVDISAQSFQTLSNGWVQASGGVVIRQKDAQVTADRMLVNRENGEVVADGNVVLVREGQAATRSNRITFNYKTGEGLAPNLDMQSQSVRVISGPAKRDLSGAYLLTDALVTTCTNDPSRLHYCVTAREAEFMPGEYVLMHGGKVKFEGCPIFYYPVFKRSLVDHFGWRFIPGYESDWGAYLLTTYKMQLADLGGEFHDSLDSHSHFDYRTKRGFALGEDLSWKFGDIYNGGSHGMVGAYGIFDDDPMGEDFDRYEDRDIVEENRYRFTLHHDTYFTSSDYLTIRTSFFSDSYVMEEFYEDEYKDYVQPESYASYTHNGEYFSMGIGVNHRVNDFYQNVNRMPDAWFDTALLELGNTGIYYESQTSGGLLEYEYADYGLTNGVHDSYDTFRFDTRHELNKPFKALGFLSVVPRIAYRGTYYSKTKEKREEAYVNEFGTNDTRTVTVEGGGELRNLFELGTEVSFKAYGFYDGADGRIYRHVLEPYANWTYIPEPNLRPADLYQFDSIDKLDMGHYVRLGLRQLVQRKEAQGGISERLDLDLYTVYFFEDAQGDNGIERYGADMVWHPTDDIKIDADAVYDAKENEFDHIDFWISLWQGDRWEAAGECYYIPNDATLFTGDLRCNLSDYWAIGCYARYDSERSRCEQVTAYLQYSLDCIAFRFRTSYEPAYTRDDGSERDAKVKLSFNAWLRAYVPPRYERKLRDGYWDD